MTLSTAERIALRTEQLKDGKTKNLLRKLTQAGMTLQEFYDRAKAFSDERGEESSERRETQTVAGTVSEPPADKSQVKRSKSSRKLKKVAIADKSLETEARGGGK